LQGCLAPGAARRNNLTEIGANEAILRRSHAFLIEMFHNVVSIRASFQERGENLANVGEWVTTRQILARIREESEMGRIPPRFVRITAPFSIFSFYAGFS
jgi:hypothetical protein